MYDLLREIRVLEVAVLAPDRLGIQLADMGAEVIKIELPPYGDHVRLLGGPFNGGPAISHYRWNRGKKSLGINLKIPEAKEVFLDLVRRSDVVIDGLRYGAMERYGLGYEPVKAVNEKIVYCSLNGTGQSGPYRDLGTHGVAFDSFAGLAPVAYREDGKPYIGAHTTIGTSAGPLFGAFAVVSAIVKMLRTGEGQFLEVSEMDSSVLWRSDELINSLNRGVWRDDGAAPYINSVRYQYYETKDNKYIIFQAFEWKFWKRFCEAIERTELLELTGHKDPSQPNALDTDDGNEALRNELTDIMKTRTQSEWIEFFIKEDIPGGPQHTLREVLEDEHFISRQNVIPLDIPGIGTIQMPTTPIKLPGQSYETTPAPKVGEHNDEILRGLLNYDDAKIALLKDAVGGT